MTLQLKPLKEQVIVVTGASSGIGLVTARMAAKEGASLVLAARTEEALHQLEQEISSQGGRAIVVPADIGQEESSTRIPKPP
ncbi:SDR family NAD(P)-dependent oxidoreductase [Larkinella insperata]|uniref:SDR family NAD(P)-dependent oxidoreductase n=1 Tax=Larkinella insperata TaxID=332158 RepID=A0ABW3Q135_9BACT|nr:SDR family NAD(P)-dependent oxidoreductase [Larkinella insperata]